MNEKKANRMFVLRRKGKFEVETAGDNHCGLDEVQTIKYWVAVTCLPMLDERGFIAEQRVIDDVMQEFGDKYVTESCELLSKRCTKRIKKVLLEDNPDLKIISITVMLSAKPYVASMTHTWFNRKL